MHVIWRWLCLKQYSMQQRKSPWQSYCTNYISLSYHFFSYLWTGKLAPATYNYLNKLFTFQLHQVLSASPDPKDFFMKLKYIFCFKQDINVPLAFLCIKVFEWKYSMFLHPDNFSHKYRNEYYFIVLNFCSFTRKLSANSILILTCSGFFIKKEK